MFIAGKRFSLSMANVKSFVEAMFGMK